MSSRGRNARVLTAIVVLATACSGKTSTRAGGTIDPTTPPTEVARTVPAATSALTTTTATTTATTVTTTTQATTASTPLAVTIGGPVASVTYATAADTIPTLHDASGKPYPPPVITGIEGLPRLPLVATSVQNPNIRPLIDPRYQPIIDAYLAFQTVDIAIQGTYPINPDDPRLAQVVVPERLEHWRTDIYASQRDHDYYWVFPFGVTFRPAVSADSTDTKATVYDCVWTSDYQVDHKTGQPTPDMHPTLLPNQRGIADLTVPHVEPVKTELVNRDGHWLVTTATLDWIATCSDLDK